MQEYKTYDEYPSIPIDTGNISPITDAPNNFFPSVITNDYGYNQDYFNSLMQAPTPYQTNWNVMQGVNGRATPREIGTNIWDLGKALLGNAYQSKPMQYAKAELQEGYNRNHLEVPDKNKFGNIMSGLNTLNSLFNTRKAYKMANKQYNMQKDMWNKSWDATRKNTNEALEYRSMLRNNGDMSKVAEDMKKYGI